MRTGQALGPGFLKHRIKCPAGAAVAVADQHLTVALPDRCDLRRHRGWDFRRTVVQIGGQAIQLEMVPAVEAAKLNQLPGDGAAGDDAQRLVAHPHALTCSAWASRRACTSRLAVSTAMAASRQ